MKTLETLAIGDPCRVMTANHYVNSPPTLACKGYVIKVTPKQIVIRNEHGNACRYWRKDGGSVGGPRTLGKPDHWLATL